MKTNRNIKTTILLSLLFISSTINAATASEMVEDALSWTYQNIILVLASMVIIGACISLASLMSNLIWLQKRRVMGAEMDAEAEAQEAKPSIFKRMYAKAWSLVPMEKEADIDLGHSFDGIRELDNKLPPWWVYLFFFTIVWGILYLYVGHFRESSTTQTEDYNTEMEIAIKKQKIYLAAQANSVNENNVVLLEEESALLAGEERFKKVCSACHGMQGQGGIGPNLTDEYWIHGGQVANVFKSIKYGFPEKGMVAWKSQMQPLAIQQIASYINSIQGSNPPNPKARQGTKDEVQEQ